MINQLQADSEDYVQEEQIVAVAEQTNLLLELHGQDRSGWVEV